MNQSRSKTTASIILFAGCLLFVLGLLNAPWMGDASSETAGLKHVLLALGSVVAFSGGVLLAQRPLLATLAQIASWPIVLRVIAMLKTRAAFYSLLAFVIGVAGLARFAQSHQGLPYIHYWDEPQIASTALRMLRDGDFNPHFFNYGSLMIYLSLAVDVVHYLSLMGQSDGVNMLRNVHDIATNADTGWYWEISHPSFYLWNRWITVSMGVGLVVMVFLIARRLAGRLAGLIAAVALAGLSIHIEYSGWIATDIPTSFFTIAALLLVVEFARGAGPVAMISALASAGFAVSTKYNSATVIVPLLVGLAYAAWARLPGYRNWLWLALPIVPAFTFLLGTPFALFDLRTFLAQAGFEVYHYRVLAGLQPGLVHANLQLVTMVSNFGFLLSVLAIAGIPLILRKFNGFLILLFFVVAFTFASNMRESYHRNFLVFYPILAVSAGVGVVGLGKLAARTPLGREPWRNLACTLAFVIGSLLSASYLYSATTAAWRAGMTPETRTQAANVAAEWISAGRIPAGVVGVASELRMHPEDLQRLHATYVERPFAELACTASKYSLIITPYSDVTGQAIQASAALTMGAPLMREIEGGPVNTAYYLINPHILLVQPAGPDTIVPVDCARKITADQISGDPGFWALPDQQLIFATNAHAYTPYYMLTPGHYLFSWHASGTAADGDFAQQKAAVFAGGADHTLIAERIDEVIDEPSIATLAFSLDKPGPVRLEIDFINDYTDSKGGDRNLLISEIGLVKMTGSIPLTALSTAGQRSVPVIENTVQMLTDATISTPDLTLESGKYRFLIQAKSDPTIDKLLQLRLQVFEQTGSTSSHLIAEQIRSLRQDQTTYELPFSLAEEGRVSLLISSVPGASLELPESTLAGVITSIQLMPGVDRSVFRVNHDAIDLQAGSGPQQVRLSLSPANDELRELTVSVVGASGDGPVSLATTDIKLTQPDTELVLPFLLREAGAVSVRLSGEEGVEVAVGAPSVEALNAIPPALMQFTPPQQIEQGKVRLEGWAIARTPGIDLAPGYYEITWTAVGSYEQGTTFPQIRMVLREHRSDGTTQVLDHRVLYLDESWHGGSSAFDLSEPATVSLELEYLNGVQPGRPVVRSVLLESVTYQRLPDRPSLLSSLWKSLIRQLSSRLFA